MVERLSREQQREIAITAVVAGVALPLIYANLPTQVLGLSGIALQAIAGVITIGIINALAVKVA